VSKGLPEASLDNKKSVIEAKLRSPVTTSRGASVYRMPTTTPYEMILVWYEGDTATRILAVHRLKPGFQEKDVSQALAQAWGRDVDAFGFICRQDGEKGDILGTSYWHDDRVRIQTFVKREDDGNRLLTEWRFWPVPAWNAVARPGPERR
jgi:hypothetical protein